MDVLLASIYTALYMLLAFYLDYKTKDKKELNDLLYILLTVLFFPLYIFIYFNFIGN